MKQVFRREIGYYLLTGFHPERSSSPRRERHLVIVFTSAAGDILNEPIEEFRKTLSAFGTAVLFVMDRAPTWFNHPETDKMFAAVRSYAKRYEKFGLLGESMGGSCAITMTNILPDADRVLALAPQYSIGAPFIHFDNRFTHISRVYPSPRFWTHSHTPIKDRIQVVYGTGDWRDEIHAGMYLSEGFAVTFVAGAGHMVAAHLKHWDGNRLHALLSHFTDFKLPFGNHSVRDASGDLYRTTLDNKQEGYAAERVADFRDDTTDPGPRPTPPPPLVKPPLKIWVALRIRRALILSRDFIQRFRL